MSKAKESKRLRPVLSPEARENQLISLAMDRAEDKLLNGTESSQLITHFLKLGTEKERLEREKLAKENELLKAKTSAIEASKESAVEYAKVLEAMRAYGGNGNIGESYDEY